MAISNSGNTAGLKAAAEFLAEKMAQKAAELPSKKIPPTLKSYVRGEVGYINAGGTGGSEAMNAYMFETPGARHPLFGNRKHWYGQEYRPFMEEAAEEFGDEAAQIYADAAIEVWKEEGGFY
jgi:hypothetical protein